jgi:hypothetical protein
MCVSDIRFNSLRGGYRGIWKDSIDFVERDNEEELSSSHRISAFHKSVRDGGLAMVGRTEDRVRLNVLLSECGPEEKNDISTICLLGSKGNYLQVPVGSPQKMS